MNPGRKPTSEVSESHLLVDSAFELARGLGIPKMLVLADLLTDRRAVAQGREDDAVIWLTRSDDRDDYPWREPEPNSMRRPAKTLLELDRPAAG